MEDPSKGDVCFSRGRTRKRLNDVWAAEADALVVIEWGEDDTAEWRDDARPVELLPSEIRQPGAKPTSTTPALPDDVARILEYIASMAAGYSSGLKWNEEDKLKADMMHRPDRWADVSVEQQARRLLHRKPAQARAVDVLPEPLVWALLAVAFVALVVCLWAAVLQIRRRYSPDAAMRTRLQRITMIASAVGMLALGTITIANLATNS